MKVFVFHLPGTKLYNYVGARNLKEATRKLGTDAGHYVFLESKPVSELNIKVNDALLVDQRRDTDGAPWSRAAKTRAV